QARRIFGAHRGDDFAGPQRQIEFSVALCLRNRYVLARVADIELIEGNAAFSRRRGDVDLGAERQQSWRQVAAEGGEADAAAFWRDVTNCAGSFQAMVIGVAPPFALIVENAAGIKTEIAADRAHAPMGGASDVRRGLSEHG